jgi:hypothetical protein
MSMSMSHQQIEDMRTQLQLIDQTMDSTIEKMILAYDVELLNPICKEPSVKPNSNTYLDASKPNSNTYLDALKLMQQQKIQLNAQLCELLAS